MADQEAYVSPAEIRHRIGPNGSFGLNNVSGDIRIRGVDGDEVFARARSSGGRDRAALPLVIRRAEGSLAIEIDERGGLFSARNHGSIDFDITLPRGARVAVTAVSGDVATHGLVGDQAYKTVSGDLTLVGSGGRVSATTVSGDLELAAAQPLELSLNTTSGDIQAAAPLFEQIRIRTVSGDMTLHGGFSVGTQHTIESVSGDLVIESTTGLTVDNKRGLDFTRGGSRPLVAGDGRAQLRFRSLSGDVDVAGASPLEPSASPMPAQPPSPPLPPMPPMPPGPPDSLEILRALERGEIDVDEASRRLEGANRA